MGWSGPFSLGLGKGSRHTILFAGKSDRGKSGIAINDDKKEEPIIEKPTQEMTLEEKVGDIIAKKTLKEKIGQLMVVGFIAQPLTKTLHQ